MIDPEAALLMADSRVALGREYSAPLAGATSGRLELPTGAAYLTVVGDATTELLFDAHFGSAMAAVQVEGSIVRIVYQKYGVTRKPKNEGRVALNASIPWTLVFRGGTVRVRADLAGLTLHGLSVEGGVSHMEIALPRPTDVVPVSITGGMHQVTLKRPAGVPVRLCVTGGATSVAFDRQRFGAIGGELVLASPDFETASARYDMLATGGAAGFKVLSV